MKKIKLLLLFSLMIFYVTSQTNSNTLLFKPIPESEKLNKSSKEKETFFSLKEIQEINQIKMADSTLKITEWECSILVGQNGKVYTGKSAKLTGELLVKLKQLRPKNKVFFSVKYNDGKNILNSLTKPIIIK